MELKEFNFIDTAEYRLRPITKWPRGKTAPESRKRTPFKANMQDTYRRLRYEMYKLEALVPIVIEIDLRERDIRLDGLPRADAPNPEFPGVIVSFKTKKLGPLQFVCDDCRAWVDNLRAIVLTLERLRLADIYGVTKRGEQYTGWKALPDADQIALPMTIEEGAAFISITAHGDNSAATAIIASADNLRGSYLQAVKRLHPDRGGDPGAWNKLQEAKRVLDGHHAFDHAKS